jgi:spore maturation protein CgeB
MKFKLLNISSMHSGYLESFYKKYPQSGQLSYDDHYNLLMNETTEFAGSYIRNFRKLDIDAKCVIANDAILQAKWKSENKIQAESDSDILFEETSFFKPDILWIENLNCLTADWLSTIKNKVKSIRLIVAYHCSPYNKSILEKLKKADFVITCTPGLKLALENEGIRSFLVYHGFDNDLLPRLDNIYDASTKDLVFSGSLITGGNFHNSRISLIENIIKDKIDLALYVTLEKGYRIKAKQFIYILYNLSNKLKLNRFTDRFQIFEYGRTQVNGYSDAIIRSNHQPLYGIEMYKLFKTARIVLNMHIGVAGDYAGNMRIFEVTGVGSCLLTDNKKNMPFLFDLDKEVVVYDNQDDCISKIKWLLENENERKKIAESGHKRTIESHTVLDRCKSIIDIIDNEF